jgi:hypothetical protein
MKYRGKEEKRRKGEEEKRKRGKEQKRKRGKEEKRKRGRFPSMLYRKLLDRQLLNSLKLNWPEVK